MPSTTYTIHEGAGIEIVAEVDYDIIPTSGDGWNEPREEAYVDFAVTKLVKRKRRWVQNGPRPCDLIAQWDVTDLGEAPKWVREVIANDDCWQEDILADECDGPDPDAWRDDMISRELQNT